MIRSFNNEPLRMRGTRQKRPLPVHAVIDTFAFRVTGRLVFDGVPLSRYNRRHYVRLSKHAIILGRPYYISRPRSFHFEIAVTVVSFDNLIGSNRSYA